MYLAQLGLALLMRYELSEDDAHLNEAGQCGSAAAIARAVFTAVAAQASALLRRPPEPCTR